MTNILLQNLSITVLYCSVVRPRFTVHLNRALLKKVLRWGMPLSASLLWRFYDNSDYLVVGKLLGAPALGAYTMAFRLATMVNDKISSAVNRVTFPSFSAMQDDIRGVIDHWLSVTRKLAWINFPLLVAIAMNADDFISVFLGPKWQSAAPLVKYLCVVVSENLEPGDRQPAQRPGPDGSGIPNHRFERYIASGGVPDRLPERFGHRRLHCMVHRVPPDLGLSYLPRNPRGRDWLWRLPAQHQGSYS